MFLTEIILPYETAAKRGFETPWHWHAGLWECFPECKDRTRPTPEAQQFLSRLDQVECGHRVILLSAARPSRPSWCPEPGWRCRTIPDSFFGHVRYEFSLIANPTVTKKNPQKETIRRADGAVLKNRSSVRKPIFEPVELRCWLDRQADRLGFVVESIREVGGIRILPRLLFAKEAARDDSPQAVVLHRVRFDGVLRITDPVRFATEWPKGIGRGRAFGNGFLLITPVTAQP